MITELPIDMTRELRDAVKAANEGIFISEEAMNKWLLSWGNLHELPAPQPDIFK